MPATAARYGVVAESQQEATRLLKNPQLNAQVGTRYLADLMRMFNGDLELVLAAYNAGEGAVNRYGGVPPFKETLGYLRRIQEVFSLPQHPFDPRITAPSPMLTKPLAPPRL